MASWSTTTTSKCTTVKKTFTVMILMITVWVWLIIFRETLAFKRMEPFLLNNKITTIAARKYPKDEWTQDQIFNLHKDSSTNAEIMQNDSRILKYIRKHHLIPPSAQETNLTAYPSNADVDKRFGKVVSRFAHSLLKRKKGGFFIECGANDGQYLSNTLDLETKYGWTGLLVESDPKPLKRLINRNRHAWIADVCLSTVPYPQYVEMQRHISSEGLSFQTGFRPGGNSWSIRFNASCFPLFSILSALNVTTVDYFAFDIEGAELAVLKTVPFDIILFKVMSIEVQRGNEDPVKNFMISKGFKFMKFIRETYTRDYVFAHPSVLVSNIVI